MLSQGSHQYQTSGGGNVKVLKEKDVKMRDQDACGHCKKKVTGWDKSSDGIFCVSL